jgi:hypothetical protein
VGNNPCRRYDNDSNRSRVGFKYIQYCQWWYILLGLRNYFRIGSSIANLGWSNAMGLDTCGNLGDNGGVNIDRRREFNQLHLAISHNSSGTIVGYSVT